MKTNVTIEEELFAKRVSAAHERGVEMNKLVNDLVREALKTKHAGVKPHLTIQSQLP
jgi:hypothetical protein